jgi:hypothetical protein
MKTETGVVGASQRDIATRLNAEGYLCVTARSADEAYGIIEEYLNGE